MSSHRVYTEWQWPLSDVHSLVMEKLANAGEGEGGGARPPSFTIVTITYKVAVYAPAERADTVHSPCFISTPMYSVLRTFNNIKY